MNHPEIIILPKSFVARHLVENHGRRFYYISIGESDDPMPSSLTSRRATVGGIRLEFADIRFEMAIVDDQECFGPTMDDILAIDRFAKKIHNDCDAALLVHCHAGISRSSAAALATMLSWNWPAEDAVGHLYRINPSAAPNRRMLDLMSQHHHLTPGLLDFLCMQEYQATARDMELWGEG